MLESYCSCAVEGDFEILMRNFYVRLTLSHRQLLDFAAKGCFIEIDPSIAHEIIEGIVGALPQQKGSHHTCYLLSTALVFPEEEGMMQQSSVSISLCFLRTKVSIQ